MADQKVKLSCVTTPKTKDAAAKTKTREFDVAHANRLLLIPNTGWKLADDKWKWNGKELAKK